MSNKKAKQAGKAIKSLEPKRNAGIKGGSSIIKKRDELQMSIIRKM